MNNNFIDFDNLYMKKLSNLAITGLNVRLLQFCFYRLENFLTLGVNLFHLSSLTHRYIFYFTISLTFPVLQHITRQYQLHLSVLFLLKLHRGVSVVLNKSISKKTRSSSYLNKRRVGLNL